jgi:hypothetical protein
MREQVSGSITLDGGSLARAMAEELRPALAEVLAAVKARHQIERDALSSGEAAQILVAMTGMGEQAATQLIADLLRVGVVLTGPSGPIVADVAREAERDGQQSWLDRQSD